MFGYFEGKDDCGTAYVWAYGVPVFLLKHIGKMDPQGSYLEKEKIKQHFYSRTPETGSF